MTATTLTAVDPDARHIGLVKTFKCSAAILMGAVVSFDASGEDLTVVTATASTGTAIGVAGNTTTAAGQDVTVFMNGCIVTVREDTVAGTADAGDWLMVGAVAGTVAVFDPAIGGHAATLAAQSTAPVGLALKNCVAGTSTVGATVQMLIQIGPMFTASA